MGLVLRFFIIKIIGLVSEVFIYLELYHHGIKGQKWGVRNGPPYPLNDSSFAKNILKHAIKKNCDVWRSDKDHNTLFISGISGSGKTTLANYISQTDKANVIHLDKYFGISVHDESNKMFDIYLRRTSLINEEE